MKDINELIPQLNVNLPEVQEEKSNLVADEHWLGVCDEIMNNLRQERHEVDEVKNSFVDMVINEGDSTSASKEALVNLLKIKSEISDKMSRVFDMMTRVKLKERDTFPRYLNAKQNNTINIADSSKRDLIKQIQKFEKEE